MIRKIYLVRHGQTAWAALGKHTGTTDLPLTHTGEEQAKLLGEKLRQEGPFTSVFSSPLQRAQTTAKIAGFSPKLDPNLAEWNYGSFEGLTTEEILQRDPGWNLFEKGAPQGESPEQVEARAKAVLQMLSATPILFSSAHILRVMAATWLGLKPQEGKCFVLFPASISILGYEHETPVILRWNDISHLR